jgi:VWFA-related protein
MADRSGFSILLAATLAALPSTATLTPARAQAVPAELVFGSSSEVQVVNVEVYVTRRGAPVLGLGPEDFRVYDDGRPVEVAYFSRIGGEAPDEAHLREGAAAAPPAAGSAAPAPPGHYVVFVDEIHLGASRRDRFLTELASTLATRLRPEDRVMVASYDGLVRIRLPFTDDRRRIAEALEGLADISTLQVQASLESLRALQEMRDFQRAAGNFVGDCNYMGVTARAYAETTHNRVMTAVEALQGFVNSLGGVPGRKTLIHVSDGIPLIAGGEVWQQALELCDGTGQNKGVQNAVDSKAIDPIQTDRFESKYHRNEMYDTDTTSAWQRLAAHANSQNVAIYPVQATGLRPHVVPGEVDTSEDVARFGLRNVQDSLVLVARDTGGDAILNTNDFAAPLAAAVVDSRSYYLLGISPGADLGAGRHQLRVEVAAPGVEVRYRMSYWAKSPEERIRDGLLTALLHGEGDNPLQAGLTLRRPPAEPSQPARPRVRIELPSGGLTLFPRDAARHGMVSVYLVARDGEGATTPIRHTSLPLAFPRDGGAGPFVLEVEMPIDAESYQVAVAIRDDLGGAISFLQASAGAAFAR